MAGKTLLEFQNISKTFPGVKALDSVSFSVEQGEVHAIVGENGAGKSTLMKIVSGLYRQDSGVIVLSGQAAHITNPQQALALGIAMVPQELNLVPDMTVAENIMLNIEPRSALGLIDRRQLHQQASEVLNSLEVQIDTHRVLKKLSVAEQQMVQIARALANKCSILIMDEPTSALSEREKISLFKRIQILRNLGATILYISHRMQEIFEIADRVTALRDGKVIGTRLISETTQDEVIAMMIGRPLSEFFSEHAARNVSREVILEVDGLTRKGYFHDISFKLHRGEILGFAGLVGARRTELMSSLYGFPKPDSGTITLEGKPVKIHSPSDAIQLGIGYVPEERKRHGIFPVLSVLKNTTIPFLKRFARLQVVNQRSEKNIASSLVQQLRVATPSLDKQIVYLSGGNQQKVILARWLGSGAKILILDEPTRGIDVNAKAEIHALITRLADEGKSIIVISSETQELISLVDRIIVMKEGSLVTEVDPKQVTEQEVIRFAMLGLTEKALAS